MPDDDPRPVWFLARGGTPVPASTRRLPAEAAYWCREGDAEWRPAGTKVALAEQAAAAPKPTQQRIV